MPAITDSKEIFGFFSYSREDDSDSEGFLSRLRQRIQNELRGQLGRQEQDLKIFQDIEAIEPGTLWEERLDEGIAVASFFIAIISPRATSSRYCQVEFEKFLAREKSFGRTDLIFPIIYMDTPQLRNEKIWRDDPILSVVGLRQYVDWTEFRFDPANPNIGRTISLLCKAISKALKSDNSVRSTGEINLFNRQSTNPVAKPTSMLPSHLSRLVVAVIMLGQAIVWEISLTRSVYFEQNIYFILSAPSIILVYSSLCTRLRTY